MKKASVRDLRYHFPEIEAQLNKGEERAFTMARRSTDK